MSHGAQNREQLRTEQRIDALQHETGVARA
jgi:hypothetical protein